MKITPNHFPLVLRITASYFIFIGAISLVYPFILKYSGFFPGQEDMSIVHLFRHQILNLAFIYAGFVIFKGERSVVSLVALILFFATLNGGLDFARGWAGGTPSFSTLLISYLIVVLWNGMWMSFVYKNRMYLKSEQVAGGDAAR